MHNNLWCTLYSENMTWFLSSLSPCNTIYNFFVIFGNGITQGIY